MNFNSKSELQSFLARFICSLGHHPRLEVQASNGRIDILTHAFLVNCKLTLTPAVIYQARSQLAAYKNYYPGRKLIITGLSPAKYESARKVAIVLEAEIKALQIWFIAQIPGIQDFYDRHRLESTENIENEVTQPYSIAFVIFILWVTAISWVASGGATCNKLRKKLYQATRQWDMALARQAPTELITSGDERLQNLSFAVEAIVQKQGKRGLNYIQAVQTALEQCSANNAPGEKCSFPKVLNAPNQISHKFVSFQYSSKQK